MTQLNRYLRSFNRRRLEWYVVAAIIPYLCLALALFTTMLLAQQSSRFADILGITGAPLGLASNLIISLVPNVLILTIPMAMLTGVIIGFSRLVGDRELLAMRAAGVSTSQLILPVLMLGAMLAGVSLYLGWRAAPRAAQALRGAVVRAALARMQSPIEPRTFYTDLPGTVIYVRDGDQRRGQWERVFIHDTKVDGQVRLVTARTGRIDTTGDQDELVLSDVGMTTLPTDSRSAAAAVPSIAERTPQLTPERAAIVIEHTAHLRFKLPLLRNKLSLDKRPIEPDEMEWQALRQRAEQAQGSEQIKMQVAMHRRLALCVAPFVFALLGTALGLTMHRGGRGSGAFVALSAMALYYLATLAGEQMSRAGSLPPAVGAWSATALTIAISCALFAFRRTNLLSNLKSGNAVSATLYREAGDNSGRRRASLLVSLLNKDILGSLGVYFLISLISLVTIFMVFTVLELWRFIAASGASSNLVARYVFYLIPLAAISLAAMAQLLAVLATYALMARRSEAIAWWSCGQSVYKLALPSLVFAVFAGALLWFLQETVLPTANQKQDALRSRIRGGTSSAVTPEGVQWLANPSATKLYSFTYNESDKALGRLTFYEFDGDGIHLRSVVSGKSAAWTARPQHLAVRGAQTVRIDGAKSVEVRESGEEIVHVNEPAQLFSQMKNIASHLSYAELRGYIDTLKLKGDTSAVLPVRLTLLRRQTVPASPLVMTLIGVPLSLAYGRRGAITALFVAVAGGVVFWSAVAGFQQLGLYKIISPVAAVWGPLVIFAALGTYALFRTRT